MRATLLRRVALGASLAFAVAACGGGDATGLPRPSTIEIAAPAQQLFVGQSVQLSARALDAAGGDLASGEATWASSNPDVATVTPTGLLTAVSPGTAQVRATINGRAGTMPITVEGAPVALATVTMPGTSFSPSNVLVRAGGQVEFVFPVLAHNVTFQGTATGTPLPIPATSGQSVRRSFGTVGDFPYECTLHPGMTGVVRVR
jgi:plastocyanin